MAAVVVFGLIWARMRMTIFRGSGWYFSAVVVVAQPPNHPRATHHTAPNSQQLTLGQ